MVASTSGRSVFMRHPVAGLEHRSHVLGVEVEDHEYAVAHDRVDVARLEQRVEPQAHREAQALCDRGKKPSPAVQKEEAQRREQRQDAGRYEEGEDRRFDGPMPLAVQLYPPPVDLQELVSAEDDEPDHLQDQEHADRPYRPV